MHRRLSRTEVRKRVCPACGAGVGERCTGSRGKPREANHQERAEAVPNEWDAWVADTAQQEAIDGSAEDL